MMSTATQAVRFRGPAARRWGAVLIAGLLLAACGLKPEIVAGGPTTVTMKSAAGSPPDAAAAAYCADYGREAAYRGKIAAGQLGGANMYAYDCIDPSP